MEQYVRRSSPTVIYLSTAERQRRMSVASTRSYSWDRARLGFVRLPKMDKFENGGDDLLIRFEIAG